MARDARRASSRLSGQGARAPDAATGTKSTRASTRVQSTTTTDAAGDDAGRDDDGGAAGEDGTVVNVPRRARTGACARARSRCFDVDATRDSARAATDDDDSYVRRIATRRRLRKSDPAVGEGGGDGDEGAIGSGGAGGGAEARDGAKTEEKRADARDGRGGARAGAKRREAEKKSTATTVKPRSRKNGGVNTKEREIAEALFDLATLAADVDRETEAAAGEKNGKRKRSRTTKKGAGAMFAAAAATTTTNGGLTNASAGTGYGMHAAAGFGAGLGLGQFSSAFPPPPVGYFGGSQGANPYGISLPRPKNAALHVYISHFIDYTQQVVRQTAPALDAGVDDVAPRHVAGG